MPRDYAEGLGFLIQPENVARYEDGKVIILDRRVYPMKLEYVTCRNYVEVVDAIRNMVTQSMGPWLASAYGMVIAAHVVKSLSKDAARAELIKAADVL